MKLIHAFLNAKLFVSEGTQHNWIMLFFLAILSIVMIGSSHNVEYKVHKISALNKEVQHLRSVFTEQRTQLMNRKMQSTLLEILEPKGITRPTKPVQELVGYCQ